MTVLPRGWHEVDLSEIVTSVRKNHPLKADAEYELWSVPSFSEGKPDVVLGSVIKSGKLAVEPGDVLISKINPRINRVWVVAPSNEGLPQISSTEWLVARIKSGEVCTASFLRYCLSAPKFREWISASASSVTGSHMRAKTQQILEQEIWLPPLAEQERIVDILEEQFSRLDSALASIRVVREKAQAFRRSLLHAAFSGEFAGGTNGWREIALDDVAELSLGVMLDKKKETGLYQVPYLANINVRWGSFDLRNVKEMQVLPQQMPRAEVRTGDIVVCEGGEPGRAAVWLNSEPVAIQKALHRIRPSSELSPFFVFFFLEMRFRNVRDDLLFTGTTIKHLPKEKLKTLVISLPPLATQERIVSLLEEQFSRLDNALEVANQLEARIASVRRSQLHAAFTGKLTAKWRETHV